MLKEERQQAILERLRLGGKVVVTELISRFNVSEDTIRRDLDDLAEMGVLQRVHGGALPRVTATPYDQRAQEGSATKQALAHATAEYIHDGQVILMDSGSSVLAVATALPVSLRATIVTNSVPVAAAFNHHPDIEVQILGGRLNKDAQAMVGVPVVETLRHIRADLCVLGVCNLHPELGMSMLDMEESYVKRAMIEQAAEVIAVADASKLGTAAPFVIGPIRELTYLVTDSSITPDVLVPYEERGIKVIRCQPPTFDGDVA